MEGTSHQTNGVIPSRRVVSAILAIAVALLLLTWLWQYGAERRAVLSLPPAERAAVFARELANFKTLCTSPAHADSLADQCRAKASFLREFPECDSACAQIIGARTTQPVR
jgi:hypothetical protein